MSDTPRTDAETGDGQGKAGRVFVKAEFARGLERELVVANSALEDSRDQLRDETNDADQYFKDNVELIAQNERTIQLLIMAMKWGLNGATCYSATEATNTGDAIREFLSGRS